MFVWVTLVLSLPSLCLCIFCVWFCVSLEWVRMHRADLYSSWEGIRLPLILFPILLLSRNCGICSSMLWQIDRLWDDPFVEKCFTGLHCVIPTHGYWWIVRWGCLWWCSEYQVSRPLKCECCGVCTSSIVLSLLNTRSWILCLLVDWYRTYTWCCPSLSL